MTQRGRMMAQSLNMLCMSKLSPTQVLQMKITFIFDHFSYRRIYKSQTVMHALKNAQHII